MGQGEPLFCIHPSGGDIGNYRKLARHFRGHPVLGIQSRLAAGACDEFPTIEAMAVGYEQLIVDQQPEGPIRLLGFSFGGFVATAISTLLLKRGREVAFLGLVDSDLRWLEGDASNRNELRLRLVQLSNRFQEMGVFNQVSPARLERDVEEIAERSVGASDFSSNDMLSFLVSHGYTSSDSPHAKTICDFTSRFLTHCHMVRRFQVSTIDSPMSMWWPSDPIAKSEERLEAWQAHTTEEIVEHTLEGSHFSIMRMPAVQTLASQVSKILADVSDNLSGVQN